MENIYDYLNQMESFYTDKLNDIKFIYINTQQRFKAQTNYKQMTNSHKAYIDAYEHILQDIKKLKILN